MVEDSTDQADLALGLLADIRSRLGSIDRRLEQIEKDRVAFVHRFELVEQNARAFVDNSATTNQRLDDIVARLERQEAARV